MKPINVEKLVSLTNKEIQHSIMHGQSSASIPTKGGRSRTALARDSSASATNLNKKKTGQKTNNNESIQEKIKHGKLWFTQD